MKKFALAMAITLAASAPAFAADEAAEQTATQLHTQAGALDAQGDVKADADAVAKDNAAIAAQKQSLAKHSADLDTNKSNVRDAAAAGDSAKVAGSHVTIKAKQAKKPTDQKIMQNDQQHEADTLAKKNDADAQAGASARGDSTN